MKAMLTLLLLLASGCSTISPPIVTEQKPIATSPVTYRLARSDSLTTALREASSRAAYPNLWKRRDKAREEMRQATADIYYLSRIDSLQSIQPDSVREVAMSAAKVAAVMVANDITLPQVAAFLQQYGWIAVPGPLPDLDWPASTPGTYPITHYVALLAVGVGSPTLQYYLPNAVGAKAALVAAVDNHGNISRISLAGWSDDNPSAALPGLRRFVDALDDRTIDEVEQ